MSHLRGAFAPKIVDASIPVNPHRIPQWIVVNILYDPCANRVIDYVIADSFNAFLLPERPIMVSRLPDSSGPTHRFVYAMCGPAFHAPHDIMQFIAVYQLKHPMQMIWHYDLSQRPGYFGVVGLF